MIVEWWKEVEKCALFKEELADRVKGVKLKKEEMEGLMKGYLEHEAKWSEKPAI